MPRQTAKPQRKYKQSEIDKLLGSKPYNEKEHPDEIISILAEGLGPAEFCKRNRISMDTFWVWTVKHPEFKEAYAVAKAMGQAWYELKARNNVETRVVKTKDSDGNTHSEEVKFNATLWSMLMRNRFGYTEHRKIGLKGINKIKMKEDGSPHVQRYNKLIEALAEENVTASEATAFAKIIEAGAKLYETEELLNRIEQLETQLRGGHGVDEFKEEA